MKVIVSFSGGKDSLASLLWVRNNLTKDFITVFCDIGWEHPLTYKYIEEVQEQLGLNLITVKSKKFNGMVDYYIAVLNQWFCPKCYQAWYHRATYYPEDAKVENRNFEFYKNIFGL